MHNMLIHTHSGLRWLLLLFLILAIAGAWRSWSKKESYPSGKMPLLAFIFTHLQLFLGLTLYGISHKVQFTASTMGNALLRFFTVEHASLMLIAAVLITIGYMKAKKQPAEAQGHKTIFTYYLIGLIIMLLSIPWPFRTALGAGWF